MSPSFASRGDFGVDSLSRLVTPPLLWNMDNIYGTTKRLHQYSKGIGTIELDDFIKKKRWLM
jgi:hypothetical protein